MMAGFAAALSPDDMRSLAAYYAGQKLIPEQARDKDTIELGQQIFRGGIAEKSVPACAGCHGPTGAGVPAQYPLLGGQYAEYIEAQLKAFRSGERANDPNRMMRMTAAQALRRRDQGGRQLHRGSALAARGPVLLAAEQCHAPDTPFPRAE